MNLDQLARDAGAEARAHVATIQAPAPGVIARRSRRRRIATASVATAIIALAGIGLASGLREDAAPTDLQVTDDSRLTDQTTFVSPRNGFSVEVPDGGEATVTPATQILGFSERTDDGFDVVNTGEGAVFRGASTELPEPLPNPDEMAVEWEVLIDEWVDGYVSADRVWPDGCGVPRSQQAEITIDGRTGRIAECPNRMEATVVDGGRLYLFSLSQDSADARAAFDALVATIDLTPETAFDVPDLRSTFVSPTNGFTFGFLDRGGLETASGRWDPVNVPYVGGLPTVQGFDVVETGMGALFMSASTEIPAGVSVDEWVDTVDAELSSATASSNSTWSRCYATHSHEEAVTIDGRAGRIFECPRAIVATVVAGGRFYLFTLAHDRSDGRAWFDAWIATIDLTPETATVP